MSDVVKKEDLDGSIINGPDVKPATFTAAPRVPFVMLVVTDCQGGVLGVISGESEAWPKLLRSASIEGSMEVGKVDSLSPLGQDIYNVGRGFLCDAKSLMWNWEGVSELFKALPSECYFTIVVNY